MQNHPTVKIVTELDIVAARQLSRNVAKEIGFGVVDQARIATATSELAKNIFLYATIGEIVVEKAEIDGKRGIIITAIDYGPGIANPHKILEGDYTNCNSQGVGLKGVKRLVDSIQIHSEIGKGTIIKIEKWVR